LRIRVDLFCGVINCGCIYAAKAKVYARPTSMPTDSYGYFCSIIFIANFSTYGCIEKNLPGFIANYEKPFGLDLIIFDRRIIRALKCRKK